MIKIINIRTDGIPPGAIYVGRAIARRRLAGSPLGNPYRLEDERQRAQVFAQYETWLHERLTWASPQRAEIDYLTDCARAGDLVLACWCAPALCHADAIADVIEKRLRGE